MLLQVVLKMPVSNPFSIALFENRLYWSNADGREIKSCDKFTGKRQRTLVRESKQRILGIHIYHPSLTPEVGTHNYTGFCCDTKIWLIVTVTEPVPAGAMQPPLPARTRWEVYVRLSLWYADEQGQKNMRRQVFFGTSALQHVKY